MPITAILALIAAFPQALGSIQALWADIRGAFSTEDQAQVDAALKAAQAQDETDTAMADVALDQAAKE